MIDIHTHILPGVDDGSPDLETSIQHLKMMQNNGVECVFLTSHYMRQYYEIDHQLYKTRFDELQQAVRTENIEIKLIPGREIYLDSSIFPDVDAEILNMGTSDYVLVETNMTSFPSDLNEILYNLVRKGKNPIMAHPERYANIINDPAAAEELLHKNILMQINSGSVLGRYGKNVQKAAWYLIDNGFAHFLASDNHCRELEYDLPEAVEKIKTNIDEYVIELLTEVNPQRILNNEPIPHFYLEKEIPEKKGFFSRFFKG